MRHQPRHLLARLVLLALAAAGCANTRSSEARIPDPLPWHDDGVWLRGDTHTHFLMSQRRGESILQATRQAGADFVASTEHTDRAFYVDIDERLRRSRAQFPELIILAGVEWNLPAGDHATVILEAGGEEWRILRDFVREFDCPPGEASELDQERDSPKTVEHAAEGLRWLRDQEKRGHTGLASAVCLSHMARRDLYSVDDVRRLVAAGLAGIEASPGHQRSLTDQPTIDRFDPFIAEVGGGYDQIVAGDSLGVVAASDFHNPKTAYYPGTFSQTLVYCPDRSAEGVVRGLQRGSTVAAVGRLVDAVEARTTTPGAGDAALIGETLRVARGADVRYLLSVTVPALDALGRINQLDEVEVISNFGGRPRVVHRFPAVPPGNHHLEYQLPDRATARAGTFFLRSRGRRKIRGKGNDAANADLAFYTAATRVEVGSP